MGPRIVENYREYTPPFEIVPTIRRALKVVPKKYLVGLDRIVLTNAGGLPRRRRRKKTWSRKRKVLIKTALGVYRGGHIEIFVDNIVGSDGKWPYSRRQCYLFEISRVLFHEIGHHIHRSKRPEYREPENVADRYMRIYLKRFVWRSWYRVGAAAAHFIMLVVIHPRVWWRVWRSFRLLANRGDDSYAEAA